MLFRVWMALACAGLIVWSAPAAVAQAQKVGQGGAFPGAPRQTYDYRTQIPAERPATTARPGFTFAAAGDLIYALPLLPRQDAGVEAIAAGDGRGRDVHPD
jgi:hypothetical protein